jgi:hypothetical protein
MMHPAAVAGDPVGGIGRAGGRGHYRWLTPDRMLEGLDVAAPCLFRLRLGVVRTLGVAALAGLVLRLVPG